MFNDKFNNAFNGEFKSITIVKSFKINKFIDWYNFIIDENVMNCMNCVNETNEVNKVNDEINKIKFYWTYKNNLKCLIEFNDIDECYNYIINNIDKCNYHSGIVKIYFNCC